MKIDGTRTTQDTEAADAATAAKRTALDQAVKRLSVNLTPL